MRDGALQVVVKGEAHLAEGFGQDERL